MKRAAKVTIVIAIIFIVTGVMVTAAAGIVIYSTGVSWYDGIEIYDARVMSYSFDSVTGLELDLLNEPVTVKRGGDRVTVEWSQRYDGQYSLSGGNGGRGYFSRKPHGTGFTLFPLDVSWLTRFWRDEGIEDGSARPITVTVPEGLDLDFISINGIDLRVTLDNIDARRISVDAINAVVTFRHSDITKYNFQTDGVGSVLRVDGRPQGSWWIGESSYTHPGASRPVNVSGVNAELNVWRD